MVFVNELVLEYSHTHSFNVSSRPDTEMSALMISIDHKGPPLKCLPSGP